MTEEHGVPARELSDAELERQGVQAHATRHWVFLHGTAEQFRTHTQRMLELEQEYLRRHPQRTWQGSGGADASRSTALARDARIRDLIHTLSTEVLSLLDDSSAISADQKPSEDPEQARSRLLAAFAAAPNGSLHKLEAHQIARGIASDARLVASLYKDDPPLLVADGDRRHITDAGRAWLADHPAPATAT
jgi:hypothetical protein